MRFNPTVSLVLPALVPGVFAQTGRRFTASCCVAPTTWQGGRTTLNPLARVAPAAEGL
jgi:hypothetical protein